METKIVRMGINGEGIGYDHEKPVFIAGALTEETVRFHIVERYPRYAIGHLDQIVHASADRVIPACHERGCNGCALRHLSDHGQIPLKEQLCRQAVQKYAEVGDDVFAPLITSDRTWGYRNQCKLPVIEHKGHLVNAIYDAASNRPHPITRCLVHEPMLEEARIAVLRILETHGMHAYDKKTKRGIRFLIMRHLQGQLQVTLSGGAEAYPEPVVHALMAVPGVVSLYRTVQTSRNARDPFGSTCIPIAGQKQIAWQMDGIRLRISPRSFFQLNTLQAQKLYRHLRDVVKPCNCLIEAYSGIGGISLFLKDRAKRIIGVEVVPDAVTNANRNAKENGADHVSFLCGDAPQRMHELCRKNRPDCIVVDPPRTGMTDDMLEALNDSHCEQIVYVSCNPSTLGKNLFVLQKRYYVQSITPLDMFSQTPLVESITVLRRKK